MTVTVVVAVLTWLYALVPVVSALGWAPQVWRLVKDPSSAAAMSVVTWGVWSLTGIVSLAYVTVVVSDPLLVVTFFVNAVGQVTVCAYALAARARR